MEIIILSVLIGILIVVLGIIVYLQYQNRKQIKQIQVKIEEFGSLIDNRHNEVLEHIAQIESELNQSLAKSESEFENLQNSFFDFKSGVNNSFTAFKKYFEGKLQVLDTEVKRVIRQY
jgi:predicted PurR-regulated permease PerM